MLEEVHVHSETVGLVDGVIAMNADQGVRLLCRKAILQDSRDNLIGKDRHHEDFEYVKLRISTGHMVFNRSSDLP